MIGIEFRPATAADLEEVADWYEAKQGGLGLEFLDAVHATLGKIAKNPKLYRILHRDTRRALIRRFPYGIYFRAMPSVVKMHGRACPTDSLDRNGP